MKALPLSHVFMQQIAWYIQDVLAKNNKTKETLVCDRSKRLSHDFRSNYHTSAVGHQNQGQNPGWNSGWYLGRNLGRYPGRNPGRNRDWNPGRNPSRNPGRNPFFTLSSTYQTVLVFFCFCLRQTTRTASCAAVKNYTMLCPFGGVC